MGEGGFSTGLRRRSTIGELVEKELGLKSSGDVERIISTVERLGARGDLALSGLLAAGPFVADNGEPEAPQPSGSPFEETGEMLLSGFAMRRPPRDSARLRSPSIVSGGFDRSIPLAACSRDYSNQDRNNNVNVNDRSFLKRYMEHGRDTLRQSNDEGKARYRKWLVLALAHLGILRFEIPEPPFSFLQIGDDVYLIFVSISDGPGRIHINLCQGDSIMETTWLVRNFVLSRSWRQRLR